MQDMMHTVVTDHRQSNSGRYETNGTHAHMALRMLLKAKGRNSLLSVTDTSILSCKTRQHTYNSYKYNIAELQKLTFSSSRELE